MAHELTCPFGRPHPGGGTHPDTETNVTKKTARERLIRALTDDELCMCGGPACPTPEALVDEYAHQLAEQIRATDLPEIHVDMFDNGTQWAADLIDPEATR